MVWLQLDSLFAASVVGLVLLIGVTRALLHMDDVGPRTDQPGPNGRDA